jgi:hypothetical protein
MNAGSLDTRHVIPLFLLFISGLLAGCNNTSVVGDTSSRFFDMPVGSTFTLNREITILPHSTSTYVQFARTGPDLRVNTYHPNCRFEVFSISESERVVKPDVFTVTRVVNQFEQVSLDGVRYAGPIIVADDGGPMFYNYMTTMYLKSEKQPDVFRITCQVWDYIYNETYLSIDQMREAVGDVFTISIAE